MAKRTEVEYEYKPRHSGIWGIMQYEIYDNEQEALVILTDLPQNTGRSVTNEMEGLATQIVANTTLSPETTRWIQHQLPQSFLREGWHEVTFQWSKDAAGWDIARNASWRNMRGEEVSALLGER